jgi:hypothetical protein
MKIEKSAFCPRLFSSLGCASARKLRLGRKRCTFQPRYTMSYLFDYKWIELNKIFSDARMRIFFAVG